MRINDLGRSLLLGGAMFASLTSGGCKTLNERYIALEVWKYEKCFGHYPPGFTPPRGDRDSRGRRTGDATLRPALRLLPVGADGVGRHGGWLQRLPGGDRGGGHAFRRRGRPGSSRWPGRLAGPDADRRRVGGQARRDLRRGRAPVEAGHDPSHRRHVPTDGYANVSSAPGKRRSSTSRFQRSTASAIDVFTSV